MPKANTGKIHVMQLIAALEFGGAERLATTISASLPKEQFEVSVCGFAGTEGPLVKDLRRNSISYYYLDAAHKNKIGLSSSLYTLLRKLRVDILQVHGAYFLLNCFLPARAARTKVIYTEHAKQTLSHVRSASFAAKYFSYGTEKIVCVSENLRSFFQDVLKVSDRRLQVIHNGIDPERFKASREPFSGPRPEMLIGCIARLTEAKDHANLLTAFSILKRKGYEITLVLVGEGELRSDIEAQIEALHLNDHVVMLGNRNDIPELLADMDIFVLPSKREGFPVSILEAMAAGRPVVATDVGGVSEVIEDGQNGLIVPPQKPEALGNALQHFLDNRAETLTMAGNGCNLVTAHFSVQAMMNKYITLYHKISSS